MPLSHRHTFLPAPHPIHLKDIWDHYISQVCYCNTKHPISFANITDRLYFVVFISILVLSNSLFRAFIAIRLLSIQLLSHSFADTLAFHQAAFIFHNCDQLYDGMCFSIFSPFVWFIVVTIFTFLFVGQAIFSKY